MFRSYQIGAHSCRYPSSDSSQLDLQFLQHPTADKYSAITAYGASKLCNLLFALEFHRRNVEDGISCNAVHPGNLLPTGLSSNAGFLYRVAFTAARLFTKSVVSGCGCVLQDACSPAAYAVYLCILLCGVTNSQSDTGNYALNRVFTSCCLFCLKSTCGYYKFYTTKSVPETWVVMYLFVCSLYLELKFN